MPSASARRRVIELLTTLEEVRTLWDCGSSGDGPRLMPSGYSCASYSEIERVLRSMRDASGADRQLWLQVSLRYIWATRRLTRVPVVRTRKGPLPLPPPRSEVDVVIEMQFPHLEDTRLRTAITRACKATGTPHWSPHDLRHRRVWLLVLRGTPIPRVSAYVGHARGSMTLDTYAHVLLEPTELDYAALIA